MIRPGSRATIEMVLVLLLFAFFFCEYASGWGEGNVNQGCCSSEHAFLTIKVAAQAD